MGEVVEEQQVGEGSAVMTSGLVRKPTGSCSLMMLGRELLAASSSALLMGSREQLHQPYMQAIMIHKRPHPVVIHVNVIPV